MSVSAFVNALSTLRTGEAPPPETPAGSLPLGMRRVDLREMSQPRQRHSAGGGGGRTSGDDLGAFADAIAELESGGSYEAVGPPTRLGRARGKYQIMDANWDAWAAEAGIPGASWRDPKAQERVARHKFAQYKRQFGRWDAVAVAWFAGPGAAQQYVQNPASVESRSDVLGTNVRQYVDRVMGTFNDVRQTGGRHPAVSEARRVAQRERSTVKHAPDDVWDRESVGAAARHIADTFGLDITSHWRSREHNRRVGGAPKSDHLWGGGVDFAGSPEQMRQLVDWAEQFTGPQGPFRIVLHPWNDPDGHDDHVHLSFHRNNSTPFTLENLGGELTPRSFAPSPHVKDHVDESGGRTQRVLGAFHRVIGGDSISGGIGQLSADIAQPQQREMEEVG